MAGKVFPEVKNQEGNLTGQIIAQDHFGNLITNIPLGSTEITQGTIGKTTLYPAENYQNIPEGKAALIFSSPGIIFIAGRSYMCPS